MPQDRVSHCSKDQSTNPLYLSRSQLASVHTTQEKLKQVVSIKNPEEEEHEKTSEIKSATKTSKIQIDVSKVHG